MLARLSAALLLTLAACASHEGPAPAPTPTQAPTPTPEPHAELTLAVASVQLNQDCPDPATDATPAAAAAATAPSAGPSASQPYAPPPPVQKHTLDPGVAPQHESVAVSAKRMAPSDGTWSPPCVQSTMQLSLANTGPRAGTIEIKAVRLLDAKSRRELGTLVSRKPSEWNTEGSYRPWDQQVAPGATIKAAYRLSEPDWGRVQTLLGDTVNTYAQPLLLELDIAVDGHTQTVRSPEFVREPSYMIVT